MKDVPPPLATLGFLEHYFLPHQFRNVPVEAVRGETPTVLWRRASSTTEAGDVSAYTYWRGSAVWLEPGPCGALIPDEEE